MSGLHYAVEDRKADAVAHLALARSQKRETAFRGITRDKRQLHYAAVLFGYRTVLQEIA